ncbi:hypothetical protein GGR55DRAFT_416937 [Xylaria sp. FL0064]|nr:hypothetical protein GGR55DRAFT_416937 [Xylaria sp. FL0064]
MGHVCNKYGLTEMYPSGGRYMSDTMKEMNPKLTHLPLPIITYGTQSFANPLFPVKPPQISPFLSPVLHDTPKREKWKSARDMFTQYGISRPSSWLSDIEDLSLSGDGNASPRRHCRHCHICSAQTWTPTHCSSCGHRLCERCSCEVSGGTPHAHADYSHHQSHTTTRDESQDINASRSNLDSGQNLRQQQGITDSTFNSQHEGKINTQRNRSSRYRTDSSWLSRDDEHGVRTTLSGNSTPIMRDSSHKREERYGQVQSRPQQLIEKNPFLFRDRKSRERETESDISSHSANRVECDDPVCRATHAGHHPFRHSVSCPKHQSEQKSPALHGDSAPGGPTLAEAFENPALDTNLPPEQPHTVHRHHSAGFHSSQHIAEHLSSAVGHNAYDLVKERKKRNIQPASSSKTSIKPGLYIEPLTKAKSVTGVGSFQWSPDPIGPGHPARSGNGRRSPATKATTNGPNRRLSRNTSEKITHEVRDTMPGEASVHGEPIDVYNDSNVSLHNSEPPKFRLASTPSWLRNPTKKAADATAPLHHINTKSHGTHERSHGYLSSVKVDG